MKIGMLARRTGLNSSAIRYYERVGLLGQPQRVSGQRQGNRARGERDDIGKYHRGDKNRQRAPLPLDQPSLNVRHSRTRCLQGRVLSSVMHIKARLQ